MKALVERVHNYFMSKNGSRNVSCGAEEEFEIPCAQESALPSPQIMFWINEEGVV